MNTRSGAPGVRACGSVVMAAGLRAVLAARGSFGSAAAAAGPPLEASTTKDAAPSDAEPSDALRPEQDPTKPLVGSTCNGAVDCARYVFVTTEGYSGTDLGGA